MRPLAVLVVTVLMTGLTACDPRSEPITPRGAGYQLAPKGSLEIWFGEPCRDVVEIRLELVEEEGDNKPAETLVLRAPGYVPSTDLPRKPPEPGTGAKSLVGMRLGQPVEGLEAVEPLPDGVDWRTYHSIRLLVVTTGGQAADYLIPERLQDEAGDHDADEYFVQDQGWFDKSAFTDASGGDFNALCSGIDDGIRVD